VIGDWLTWADIHRARLTNVLVDSSAFCHDLSLITAMNLSRISRGVMPNFMRNAREKCEELLKPLLNAISLIARCAFA
jgi:hypothetical protein